MGWASGSAILSDSWQKVRKHVPEKKRAKVLADLIEIFEVVGDCDTCYEIEDDFPEARKALELAGHEFEGDE